MFGVRSHVRHDSIHPVSIHIMSLIMSSSLTQRQLSLLKYFCLEPWRISWAKICISLRCPIYKIWWEIICCNILVCFMKKKLKREFNCSSAQLIEWSLNDADQTAFNPFCKAVTTSNVDYNTVILIFCFIIQLECILTSKKVAKSCYCLPVKMIMNSNHMIL